MHTESVLYEGSSANAAEFITVTRQIRFLKLIGHTQGLINSIFQPMHSFLITPKRAAAPASPSMLQCGIEAGCNKYQPLQFLGIKHLAHPISHHRGA